MTASLKDVFIRALELSSLKGVPRIVKSKNVSFKCLWIIAVFLLFGAVIIQVRFIYREYNENPVVMELDELHFEALKNHLHHGHDINYKEEHFPSVTLCNLSPFRSNPSSNVTMTTFEYSDLVERFGQEFKELNTNFDDNLLPYLRSIRGYYQNIQLDDVGKLGHQAEDMIAHCYFRGPIETSFWPCKELAVIERFTTTRHFNCYTIKLQKHSVGPTELNLIIYLDDFLDDLIPTFNAYDDFGQDSGATLSLHHSNTLPDVKKAINLPPGYKTKVNVKMKLMNRLGPPYGDCVAEPSAVVNSAGRYLNYSREACVEACRHEYFHNNCSCTDAESLSRWPIYNKETLPTPHNYCGYLYADDLTKSIENLECFWKITDEAGDVCSRKCLKGCAEFQYDYSTSLSKWPREHRHLGFYNDLIKGRKEEAKFRIYEDISKMSKNGSRSDALKLVRSEDLITRNFLQVSVVFDPLVTLVTENVKITTSDYMSTIGSILNLYSGITAIILVELVELVFHICILISRKLRCSSLDVTPPGSVTKEKVNNAI